MPKNHNYGEENLGKTVVGTWACLLHFQSDQIGLFLKVLGYKSSLNFWLVCKAPSFQKKTWAPSFGATFDQIGFSSIHHLVTPEIISNDVPNTQSHPQRSTTHS